MIFLYSNEQTIVQRFFNVLLSFSSFVFNTYENNKNHSVNDEGNNLKIRKMVLFLNPLRQNPNNIIEEVLS